MEINENFVTEEEQVAENVEAITTEETVEEDPKIYSEKDFNAKLDEVLPKKISRAEARIRKEYDKKYGNLENVLRAGTGKNTVEEMTDVFAEHYEKRGIPINRNPGYSDGDIETLAKADAADIISGGYDEVAEELNRLDKIGFDKMTKREKVCFRVLAEHRKNTDVQNELEKIGVTEEVYNSKKFKDFSGKFNSSTPITEIYKIFMKTQPKKDIKPMGSMKNAPVNEVKDFYSAEEISKMTVEDLKNPKVWEAVRRSMTGV